MSSTRLSSACGTNLDWESNDPIRVSTSMPAAAQNAKCLPLR